MTGKNATYRRTTASPEGSEPSPPDYVLSDYFARSLVSSIPESKDFILGNIFVETVFTDDLHHLINITRCGSVRDRP
jgi:hypothetical protein